MPIINVLLGFLRLPLSEKISFYRNVIARLTGNASFSTPDVSLNDATSQVNALETAFLASQDGSKTARLLMREKEAIADETFRKLANYVERIANNDEAKISASGFMASQPHAIPHRPDFVIESGSESGTVKLSHKAMPGARAYVWQCIKDQVPVSEEDWKICGHSTQASTEISGLSSGSRYWFRVAAITTEGTTACCSPIMKLVE